MKHNFTAPSSCEDNELMKFTIPSFSGCRKSNSIYILFLFRRFLAGVLVVVVFFAGVFLLAFS
jgi:hypothetical protein